MSLAYAGRLLLLLAAAAAAQLAHAAAAPAEAGYPSKPIRLIVPFSPGGTNDVLGRLVAQHLTEAWGRPTIVDNRTGAEGIIGTDIVAKANPDGYSLVLLSAAFVMNPAVRKLPYRTPQDFELIAKLGATFTILSVGPALPITTLKDLLAVAKAKPGQIVITSSGGFQHFASALFRGLSGQDFNIVLYKGAVPAMLDVMSGQAHATFAVSVPALPHLRSGKLRGLAVGSMKRASTLPDIPTLDELGIKGYEASNWYSIATTAGTPRPVVMKLHNEIANFLRSPDAVKRITAMGAEIDLKTPDELRKIIPEEIAKWTKVATEAGIPREMN